MADALDAGQAQVEADKTNTLTAMAQAGTAGVAAYEQAKTEMAAEQQRAMQAAAAAAQQRGAPAGMIAEGQSDLATEYARAGNVLALNKGQYGASRAAAQGNAAGYFGAASAAIPSIRAFNQGKLQLSAEDHAFRMEQARADHQAKLDEIRSISADKAATRAQQEKMAQLGYDFKVKQLEQYAKGLDLKAMKVAGISSGTSDYAKEMHWQAEFELKRRAADRADQAQTFNQQKAVAQFRQSAQNSRVGNYVKLQGLKTRQQSLQLAQAVAQDRSELQHNNQSFNQNLRTAQLEISRGHLDLARNSAQFNQALARSKFVVQGQQWAANQAAQESRFTRGQASTQSRWASGQARSQANSDRSYNESTRRFGITSGRAGTSAAQQTDRYNAWVGAGRPVGSQSAKLTPKQRGENSAEAAAAGAAWNTSHGITSGKGTDTQRRVKVLNDIAGSTAGGTGSSSYHTFLDLVNHAGASYAKALAMLDAATKAGDLAKPGHGSRAHADSGVIRDWVNRYYSA